MVEHRSTRASLPIVRQKIFLAVLAFSAGILFASHAPGYRPPLWWLLAAVMLATAAILLRSLPRVEGALALLAIAGLGALGLQLSASDSTHSAASLDAVEVEIVAHITRD